MLTLSKTSRFQRHECKCGGRMLYLPGIFIVTLLCLCGVIRVVDCNLLPIYPDRNRSQIRRRSSWTFQTHWSIFKKSTKSQINSITRQTEDLSTHDSMSFVHDSEYTRTEYTRAIDVNGRGWTTGDETEEGSRVKYLKSWVTLPRI